MLLRGLVAGALLLLLGFTGVAEAETGLDHVRTAATLSCGVLTVPADYGKADVHGALADFGADLCRAVAAAVLGDATRITVAGFPDEKHGFNALEAGRIDLLMGASPSHAMEIVHGLRFTHAAFIDAEGLMVDRQSGIRSFADLAGKQVCFIGGTRAEDVLVSESARRKIKILPFPFEEDGEMEVAFLTGHCNAIFSSLSRLAQTRASFRGRSKDFVILPDPLSLEPMAPAIRAGDPQWAAVVDATLDALLTAEQNGITRADAAALRTSDDPLLHSLSGLVPGIDRNAVGPGWASRAVAAVGNFGEVFDRDIGPGSALNLDRGLNALWTRGGLMPTGATR